MTAVETGVESKEFRYSESKLEEWEKLSMLLLQFLNQDRSRNKNYLEFVLTCDNMNRVVYAAVLKSLANRFSDDLMESEPHILAPFEELVESLGLLGEGDFIAADKLEGFAVFAN